MNNVIWGVDSAARATEELLLCVEKRYGFPDIWGRYLNTIEKVSEGLTPEEISFLKGKGIKILPIYNNFRQAVGEQQGRVAAQNAIYNGQRLGIPVGVFIFANVERFFKVDADWIIGWTDIFYNSSYRPGVYCDLKEGPFHAAYCEAVEKNQTISEQLVLWGAEPDPGVTTKKGFPDFAPMRPDCAGNMWAWQYGRNAEGCSVDTLLVQDKLFAHLY